MSSQFFYFKESQAAAYNLKKTITDVYSSYNILPNEDYTISRYKYTITFAVDDPIAGENGWWTSNIDASLSASDKLTTYQVDALTKIRKGSLYNEYEIYDPYKQNQILLKFYYYFKDVPGYEDNPVASLPLDKSIASNVTCTLKFNRNKETFPIFVNVPTGIDKVIITVDGTRHEFTQSGTVDNVIYQSNISCSVEENVAFTNGTINVSGVTIEPGHEVSFKMPANAISVNATAQRKLYTLWFSVGGSGYGHWAHDSSGVYSDSTSYGQIGVICHHGDSLLQTDNKFTLICSDTGEYGTTVTFINDYHVGYDYSVSYPSVPKVIDQNNLIVSAMTSRTPKQFTFNIWKEEGIKSITYTVNGGNPITSTSSIQTTIAYNARVSWYVTLEEGYETGNLPLVDSPETFTMTEKGFVKIVQGELKHFRIEVSAYNYGTLTMSDSSYSLGSLDSTGEIQSIIIDSEYGDVITAQGNILTVNVRNTGLVRNKFTFTLPNTPGYTFTRSDYRGFSSPVKYNQQISIYGYRQTNNYNLTLNIGEGILSVNYKINNGAITTIYASETVQVPFGSQVSVYATSKPGYEDAAHNISSPYNFVMEAENKELWFDTTYKIYTLTLTTAGEGGTWTETQDSSSITSGSTVYSELRYNDIIRLRDTC